MSIVSSGSRALRTIKAHLGCGFLGWGSNSLFGSWSSFGGSAGHLQTSLDHDLSQHCSRGSFTFLVVDDAVFFAAGAAVAAFLVAGAAVVVLPLVFGAGLAALLALLAFDLAASTSAFRRTGSLVTAQTTDKWLNETDLLVGLLHSFDTSSTSLGGRSVLVRGGLLLLNMCWPWSRP